MAEVARRELGANHVVLVWAYQTRAEWLASSPATVGRAELSSDGKGWAGESSQLINLGLGVHVDDGQIQGVVVLEQRFLTVEYFSTRR